MHECTPVEYLINLQTSTPKFPNEPEVGISLFKGTEKETVCAQRGWLQAKCAFNSGTKSQSPGMVREGVGRKGWTGKRSREEGGTKNCKAEKTKPNQGHLSSFLQKRGWVYSKQSELQAGGGGSMVSMGLRAE